MMMTMISITKHINLKGMKSINMVILAALLTAIISSCSEKIEGFSDYKEAADNGRFDIAHQFIDKMNSYEQYDPLKYVFAKELEIITEDLNRENIDAIRNLFAKYKKIGTWHTNKVCEELIKKAITKKNIALCEDLMSLHKDGDFNSEINIAILDMYRESNIDKFRQFALAHIDDSDVNKYVRMYLMDNDDEDLLKHFTSQYRDNFFDNKDVVELFEKKSPETLKKMVRMEILEFKRNVPPMPAIGIVKSNGYGDITAEYPSYNSAIKDYNAKCIEMLNYAYNLNDKELANFIVNNMGKGLTYRPIGSWSKVVENESSSTVYDAYKVTTNSDDIESARQQIKVYFN